MDERHEEDITRTVIQENLETKMDDLESNDGVIHQKPKEEEVGSSKENEEMALNICDSSSDDESEDDLEVTVVSPPKKMGNMEENEENGGDMEDEELSSASSSSSSSTSSSSSSSPESEEEEETGEREVKREGQSLVSSDSGNADVQRTIENVHVSEFTAVSPVESPVEPKKTEDLEENGRKKLAKPVQIDDASNTKEERRIEDNKEDPNQVREEATESKDSSEITVISPPKKTDDEPFVTLKINSKIPFLLVPLASKGKSFDPSVLEQFLSPEQVPFVYSVPQELNEQTNVHADNSEGQLTRKSSVEMSENLSNDVKRNETIRESNIVGSDIGYTFVTSTPSKKEGIVESPVEKSIKENGK